MIAHFFNPVAAPADPELARGERIAFQSMSLAAEFAASAGERVELLTAQFPEDRFLPPPFRATPDLERSVLDLGRFAIKRKLPLLEDLFERAFEASAADIFVFTNADIGICREFYVELRARFESELDACSITRRTIPLERADSDDPHRLAELGRNIGLPHIGHDCFAFRRELLEGADLGELCIGFPPFGRVLVALLSSFAAPDRFAILRDTGLTFHLGDSRPWQHDRYLDYWRHNQQAALAVLDQAAQKRELSEEAKRIRESIARQTEL